MSTGFYEIPKPENEPVYSYAPGSKERELLKRAIDEIRSNEADIPLYIGGEEIRTGNKVKLSPPHDHQHVLGYFHEGDATHVEQAIKAALGAKEQWTEMSWQNRAGIFLKTADLLSDKYRYQINAATMVGQSKNPFQSEIDAVAELIDFLRFNAFYMSEIYQMQPEYNPKGTWNQLEYRPLEGFIFAITPFNFTSIAGNLPAAPALMGNTVIWKPNYTQVLSASIIMKAFKEAGLPDGVINLIYVDGPEAGDVIFNHKDFAGLHFTGSTKVFRQLWKIIGENIEKYRSYPRIVGETGGKDFIIAHESADVKALVTALTRGAFEYQGQKCSAVSRAYIPSNIWDEVKKHLLEDIKSIKMGGVEDFTNFFNAVIDEKAFKKITGYIDEAKKSNMAEIIAGGNYDDSKGYFVEPTVILAKDPQYVTLCEEIFGPVLTIYVYKPQRYEEALELVDTTSPYSLTGAVFSQDRYATELATKRLTNSAGNFYINDKPTGAVVGQQPFGGSRASGTNDKAGSLFNLLRWVSVRTIKENFIPPTDYRYPFMKEE